MTELLKLRRRDTGVPEPHRRDAAVRSAPAVWVATGSHDISLIHADLPERPRRVCTPFMARVVRCGEGGFLWALDHPDLRLWVRAPGAVWSRLGIVARRLAAGPRGEAWVVTDDGQLLVVDWRNARREERLPEHIGAQDIAVSWDGAVWLLTDVLRGSGYLVQHRDAGSESFTELPPPATAVALSASPEGYAWAVNGHGAIWVLHPRGAGNMPHCGLDPSCRRCRRSDGIAGVMEVTIGSDGSAWAMTGRVGTERALFFRDAEASDGFRRVSFAGRPLSIAASFSSAEELTHE